MQQQGFQHTTPDCSTCWLLVPPGCSCLQSKQKHTCIVHCISLVHYVVIHMDNHVARLRYNASQFTRIESTIVL